MMEAARDGDCEDALASLAAYLGEEVGDRYRRVEGIDPEEEPERWAQAKGRLDQARMTHSLAVMVSMTISGEVAVAPPGEE